MKSKQPAKVASGKPNVPDPGIENGQSIDMLLRNIKRRLPELEKMLAHVEDHWCMEDGLYRFYHQSFKVYPLQDVTQGICKTLQELFPTRPLNPWFKEIIAQGTGHKFELSHNKDWLRHTRPIVEAFFHADYFLKMAVKYGKQLDTAPSPMPSGWAALLYLFDLRYPNPTD